MKNNNFIKNFFEGRVKLWKSYWLVGELLNGVVILIIFNLEIYLFNTNSSVSQIPFLDFSNFTLLSKIIIFIWTVFISIGIWRSAENYKGSPLIRNITKIYIVLNFITTLYVFFFFNF